MAKDTPSRKLDQYIVRFPDGMRDELKAAAKANGRSLNAEIIHLIQQGQTATTDQITPRDLFAAAALNALIGRGSETAKIVLPGSFLHGSFLIADEMMKERDNGRT